MSKTRRFGRLLSPMVAFLTLLVPAVPGWAAEDQRNVLVLHSVRRDSVLAETGDRELSRILDEAFGGTLDYFPEYIDTARFPDQRYRTAFRDFLLSKYKGQRFTLIVALENTSLEFVQQIRGELAPDAAVVFSATALDVKRIPNSTGLIDQPDFAATIRLATRLQPETQEVFVVSGASSRDRFYESVARRSLRSLDSMLKFTFLSGLPVKELETRVSNLPAQSIVFYAMVSQDGKGENFLPIEYLDRLARVSNRPIYSWVDAAMDHGIVGGSLMRAEIGIAVVGDLAIQVLRGERADAIPLSTTERTFDRVDWRQLRRWGIAESLIPSGTIVDFREPSAWDQYRPYILGTVALLLAQTALITGLLVQRTRRRRAESQVLGNQAELRSSYERIKDLGGRLLDAQETERARVARELHDDVSQQVALLSMDLELIKGSRSKELDAQGLQDALERAQGIARSVHDLSHRLHPAKLRLIGLVPAIDGLLRELAQPGVAIAFTHEQVPAVLSPEFTLCLFRVAQEGLQNAIKHAAARNIAVHVTRVGARLFLTIVDDGKGFDVTTVSHDGLGLVSMRERVELIGGTLTVHSTPGTGTRLEVAVPLAAAETVAV